MKLKDKYAAEGAEVDYLLDTGDGQMVKSAMPGSVAAEIARCADSTADSGVEGWEVKVNGRMLFPASAFEDEAPRKAPQAEKAEPVRVARQKRGGK